MLFILTDEIFWTLKPIFKRSRKFHAAVWEMYESFVVSYILGELFRSQQSYRKSFHSGMAKKGDVSGVALCTGVDSSRTSFRCVDRHHISHGECLITAWYLSPHINTSWLVHLTFSPLDASNHTTRAPRGFLRVPCKSRGCLLCHPPPYPGSFVPIHPRRTGTIFLRDMSFVKLINIWCV